MGHEIVQIDAFASRAFAGNPAAVCVVDALDDPEWMQRVATEMNLSETAFVRARGDGAYDLKWFTPVREVELCGHATLAAAHALLEAGMAREGETLRFQTLSGELIARIGAAGMLEIDLPARPVKKGNEPKGLREAVGMAFAYAGRNSLGYELVELESAEAVRRVSPNSGGLKRID
ncbi:MAG: PhzF family phenazine biosynthesis isomerase, partial [Planctomycetota bacterium]|nr:PhzF family phenazine biosynthesis isomerase [Planctomycetota bacterium]